MLIILVAADYNKVVKMQHFDIFCTDAMQKPGTRKQTQPYLKGFSI